MIRKIFLLTLSSLVFLVSCKKEKDEFGTEDINKWIYNQMVDWYLWNNEIPSSPDFSLTNGAFYRSLLSDKDRFSFYYPDYQQLINFLNGVTLDAGFDYNLLIEEDDASVVGVVTYVKAGSPAYLKGIRRGDNFHQINEIQLTKSNYRDLIDQMQTAFDLKIERYDHAKEEFISQPTVQIDPIEFAENPIHLDTVFEIEGNKIGYLVYNLFATGPEEGSSIYRKELDETFSAFKSAAINELIIDLRYNSGGSELSVHDLASLIVPSTYSSEFVIKKRYNDEVQDFLLNSEDYGPDFLNIKFLEKEANVGDLLTNNRVFFITSDRSASASEATINALKPFMEIHIIGDTTTGKDVGSSTFHDTRNNGNTIGLQPIIVQITNNNNDGYPEGFMPDVPLEERTKLLLPLGDIEEPLLQVALNEINPSPTRKHPIQPTQKVLYSSIKERPFILPPQ